MIIVGFDVARTGVASVYVFSFGVGSWTLANFMIKGFHWFSFGWKKYLDE